MRKQPRAVLSKANCEIRGQILSLFLTLFIHRRWTGQAARVYELGWVPPLVEWGAGKWLWSGFLQCQSKGSHGVFIQHQGEAVTRRGYSLLGPLSKPVLLWGGHRPWSICARLHLITSAWVTSWMYSPEKSITVQPAGFYSGDAPCKCFTGCVNPCYSSAVSVNVAINWSHFYTVVPKCSYRPSQCLLWRYARQQPDTLSFCGDKMSCVQNGFPVYLLVLQVNLKKKKKE